MGKGSDSQQEGIIKYILACTQECIPIIFLKTVCKSDHKQPRYKKKLQSHFILFQKNLLRSSRSSRDPRAIPENTCNDAINRHCFLIACCDRGSQENDKIIADRHFFLVGPDSIFAPCTYEYTPINFLDLRELP